MKKKIFIGLIILAASLLILLISYIVVDGGVFDRPGTKKLIQGTQMNYEDISIGLSNIENDTVWLSVRDKVTGNSTSKQAKVGDKIDIYDYQITISSIKKASSLSISPGSNQGYIKILVSKK